MGGSKQGHNKSVVWPAIRLRDVCASIDYGYTASATQECQGPKFLRITDIVNGTLNWASVPFCRIGPADAEKFRLRHGDIVIARTGASTGASAYIKNPPDAVFASYLVRLSTDDTAHSRFIYYYLQSPLFQIYVRGVLGDKSAQPNASAKTLTQASLRLPPLDEQRDIARVLGAFDDKIESNRKMNRTLEGIARAIFKSWFVDFDPVIDNALEAGNPIPDSLRKRADRRKRARAKAEKERRPFGLQKEHASLFPDSFEPSDLGPIPDGWTTKGLDNIAGFLNGLALQKFPPEGDRSLPVIKIAQLRKGNTEGGDRASADLDPRYIVEDGDVLFSWSASLECVIWGGGRGALNQHLFKVTSEEYPKWFYYFWIHDHLPEFRFIAGSKATTMGHIQRHHLSEAGAVLPTEPVIRLADTLLSSLISLLSLKLTENRTLATVRDTLLPRLIQGQCRRGY